MADSKDVSRDLKELEALLKERGETLRDHQVLGLRVLWEWNTQGRGGICADEMGLGKTCTSVVHLWRLRRSGKGPFMVVCPLSVINHWKKEIERFSCGELESVCFMGMKEERRELLNSIDNELLSNQVFVIPYHLFTNEQEDLASLLNNTNFSLIVSDEAHTLKNWKSQISELMRKRLGYSQFLLLTGTPIQNDIGELYSLLSFCQPDNFPIEDIKEFVHRYKGKKELDNLREILKKYSIRRKKEIVCTTLPPLQQVIFYHGMTKKQKKLYIDILVKNRESIMAKHEFSLVNQLMHLRKAVAHPYLFPGQEPEPFTEGEHIVTASEKMRVLDALLSFLSRNGHRCLIFSQFTSLLDIVQDYLNMRGTSYERLDGSARAEERFTSINSFQRADVDVFLLSTKAGGVGLTLTAADTVIFLDSDWNPQNDMQAMARCHRIGQTKPVRVIRLIGRYTVEQMMNVRAMAKLKLTDQLTEEHNAKPAAADMTKMLEYGLASLREEKEEEHSVTDSHLERIIGLTNEKGEWMDRGEKEDKENSPEVAEEEEKDVDEKDYFYFEGVRYRVNEKDRRAMNDIMNEKGSKINEMKVWSQEEVEEMEKEKEERKERRKNMAEERKKKKWNDAGYISLNVPLPSNEEREGEGEMDEMGMDEDEGEEISFVTGDLMEPKGDAHAIIIHIVDDSGSFGSGGVFSALDSLSPSIRESYEMAGEMGDLSMGDAHLVQVKGREGGDGGDGRRIDVALILAQKKTKRDELNLSALSRGLRRLSGRVREGSEEGVSVHTARMGRHIHNVQWYAVEKTLKKELALKGIPLFVYYKPRRDGGGKGRLDNRWKSRDEEVEVIELSPERKEPVKKRRRVVMESEDEDDQPGCSSWIRKERRGEKMEEEEEEVEIVEKEEKEVKKEDKPKTKGIFIGYVFYLAEGVTHMRRMIEGEGGEVTTSILDLYDVTHAIIPIEEREKEKSPIGLLPIEAQIKGKEYVEECIKAKRVL